MSKKPKRRLGCRRLSNWIIGLILLITLSILVSQRNNTEPASSRPRVTAVPAATLAPPTVTPTPGPPTATPTFHQAALDAAQAALGPRNQASRPLKIAIQAEDRTLEIHFPVNDNLTENMILRGAQMDVLAIAQALHAVHPDWQLVIAGTFPLVDVYGNTSAGQVLLVTLSPATLDRINWSNLITDNLPLIADTYWQHPTF